EQQRQARQGDRRAAVVRSPAQPLEEGARPRRSERIAPAPALRIDRLQSPPGHLRDGYVVVEEPIPVGVVLHHLLAFLLDALGIEPEQRAHVRAIRKGEAVLESRDRLRPAEVIAAEMEEAERRAVDRPGTIRSGEDRKS